MKSLLKSILIVLIFSSPVFAQHDYQSGWQHHDHGSDREASMMRIHAFKMAYITDRLQLSSRQSADFIPLYDEYEKEVRNTRAYFMSKYKDAHPDNVDDETIRRYTDDNLDYQQAIIDLKRKYNQRFLTIISPGQLADLYNAEREFRQMLMKKLNRQQHNGNGGYRY